MKVHLATKEMVQLAADGGRVVPGSSWVEVAPRQAEELYSDAPSITHTAMFMFLAVSQ